MQNGATFITLAARYGNFDNVFGSVASEAEARLNNIYEFSPYREESTTLQRYKDQPVNGCLRK
jgi:hypothetical protein